MWTYFEYDDCFVNALFPGVEAFCDDLYIELRDSGYSRWILVKTLTKYPSDVPELEQVINETMEEHLGLVVQFKAFCENSAHVQSSSVECSLCDHVFDDTWLAFYHFRDKHWDTLEIPMTKSAGKDD